MILLKEMEKYFLFFKIITNITKNTPEKKPECLNKNIIYKDNLPSP